MPFQWALARAVSLQMMNIREENRGEGQSMIQELEE